MKIKLKFFGIFFLVLVTWVLFKQKGFIISEIKHKRECNLFVIANNFKNYNQILCNTLLLIGNDGSLQTLDSVINEPKLILRYSNLHCHSCVTKQIDLLDRYLRDVDSNKVVIFTYYKNLRDLFLFKRLNHIRFQTYNVKSLDIPLGACRTLKYTGYILS